MNQYLERTIDATRRTREELADKELTGESTLESLELNSIQLLRTLVELEEAFSIELDDDFDLEGISDLGQIAAMIEARAGTNAG